MNSFISITKRTQHLISLTLSTSNLIVLELTKGYKRIIFVLVQEDLYYPHPLVQDILWAALHKGLEPIFLHWPGKKLREMALRTAMEHIHYEDENTRYICIGPVNKVIVERGQISTRFPFNCSLFFYFPPFE